MEKEVRKIVYDEDLGIEAYRFQGVVQEFPNHFHEHYMIGFMESGKRVMDCGDRCYEIGRGGLILLNPLDCHTCREKEGCSLDFRGLNIPPDSMRRAMREIHGTGFLPRFRSPLEPHSELAPQVRELHGMIMKEFEPLQKEERFLLVLDQLTQEYADREEAEPEPEPSQLVRTVCAYIDAHYAERLTLAALCDLTGLSKYHLIRSFTRQQGISPYSYLETVRIAAARKLLEEGASPVDVALRTGFSDQSHFSNFFKKFIGLTPRQYADIFKDKKEK